MKTCRGDGVLLRPDRPAVVTPVQIRAMTFGAAKRNVENVDKGNDVADYRSDKKQNFKSNQYGLSTSKGEIWSTQTNLSNNMFFVVFASENSMQTEFELRRDLDLIKLNEPYVVFNYFGNNRSRPLQIVSSTFDKLFISLQSENSFDVFYLSPLMAVNATMRLAMLGETQKVVRVSNDRLHALVVDGDQVQVDVAVVDQEQVLLEWLVALENNDVDNHVTWHQIETICQFGRKTNKFMRNGSKKSIRQMKAKLNTRTLESNCN